MAGEYRQSGGETRLGGGLAASTVNLLAGALDVGDAGAAGTARINAGELRFVDSVLSIDIDPAADRADFIRLAGSALLGGHLRGRLLSDPSAGEGVYRILSATGSVTGSFSELSLDPNPWGYRIEARYGPNSVRLFLTNTLTLAPVPEPASGMLLVVGLAGLAWWRRWSAGRA